MATNIAIRLGIEGGAEVKRVLEDAGKTGQAALQGVGAAADAAGGVRSTDRPRAIQKMAQAAREAEAQARAQANINSLLGVSPAAAGARAGFRRRFEAQATAAEDAARRVGNAQRSMAAGFQALQAQGSAQLAAIQSRAANLEASRRPRLPRADSCAGPRPPTRTGACARIRRRTCSIPGWRHRRAAGQRQPAQHDRFAAGAADRAGVRRFGRRFRQRRSNAGRRGGRQVREPHRIRGRSLRSGDDRCCHRRGCDAVLPGLHARDRAHGVGGGTRLGRHRRADQPVRRAASDADRDQHARSP